MILYMNSERPDQSDWVCTVSICSEDHFPGQSFRALDTHGLLSPIFIKYGTVGLNNSLLNIIFLFVCHY